MDGRFSTHARAGRRGVHGQHACGDHRFGMLIATDPRRPAGRFECRGGARRALGERDMAQMRTWYDAATPGECEALTGSRGCDGPRAGSRACARTDRAGRAGVRTALPRRVQPRGDHTDGGPPETAEPTQLQDMRRPRRRHPGTAPRQGAVRRRTGSGGRHRMRLVHSSSDGRLVRVRRRVPAPRRHCGPARQDRTNDRRAACGDGVRGAPTTRLLGGCRHQVGQVNDAAARWSSHPDRGGALDRRLR